MRETMSKRVRMRGSSEGIKRHMSIHQEGWSVTHGGWKEVHRSQFPRHHRLQALHTTLQNHLMRKHNCITVHTNWMLVKQENTYQTFTDNTMLKRHCDYNAGTDLDLATDAMSPSQSPQQHKDLHQARRQALQSFQPALTHHLQPQFGWLTDLLID